jgi:outer membrane receptor protein involved in Fe transport
VPIIGQTGAYDTNEYYAEGVIPIFSPKFNFPLAYNFELDGAYREVKNSLAGTSDSWSFGGQYSIIPDITLRGSRSRTFRAPALTELFAASTPAYDSGPDPCIVSNINSGPNPKVRAANCATAFAALGANLATFTDSFVGDFTIPVTASGNPQLKNEIGNSYTYGAVVRPRFVPGLSVSMDYVKIDISNLIESLGIGNILESCYDSPGYPSYACGLFTRDSMGQVVSANEPYVNAGYQHFTAVTYTVDYDRSVNQLPFVHTDLDLGRIGFTFNALNTRQLATSISGKGFDVIENAGVINAGSTTATPRWRWLARLHYEKGPWDFDWTTHFTGGAYFDLTYTLANQNILKVGSNYTNDLSVSYKVTKWLVARLNVNNITNQQPPYPFDYSAGDYDYLGRYYNFALSAKF